MNKQDLVVGVDIGGGHISSGIVDLSEGVILEGSAFYAKLNSKGSKEEILNLWANVISKSINSVGVQINRVALAMPGPFDYLNGIALFENTDKYESLYGLNISHELSDRLGHEFSFRYWNDATAFGVGEAWKGGARDYKKSIFIALGTGIGSAFLEQGIPVFESDNVPLHGCLWHLPYESGIVDDYFSTRWLVAEYEKRSGYPPKDVLDIVERNDRYSFELLENLGTNLGELLTPWIKKFDSEVLIFGGSISKSLALFQPFIEDIFTSNKIKIRIETTQLGEKAAILGAARLYQTEVWDKINTSLPVI